MPFKEYYIWEGHNIKKFRKLIYQSPYEKAFEKHLRTKRDKPVSTNLASLKTTKGNIKKEET